MAANYCAIKRLGCDANSRLTADFECCFACFTLLGILLEKQNSFDCSENLMLY